MCMLLMAPDASRRRADSYAETCMLAELTVSAVSAAVVAHSRDTAHASGVDFFTVKKISVAALPSVSALQQIGSAGFCVGDWLTFLDVLHLQMTRRSAPPEHHVDAFIVAGRQ